MAIAVDFLKGLDLKSISYIVTDYRYQSLRYFVTHYCAFYHRMSHYLFPLPISITYY